MIPFEKMGLFLDGSGLTCQPSSETRVRTNFSRGKGGRDFDHELPATFEVVETGLKKSTFAEPRVGKPSRQADVSQESVEPPEQDPPSPKGAKNRSTQASGFSTPTLSLAKPSDLEPERNADRDRLVLCSPNL